MYDKNKAMEKLHEIEVRAGGLAGSSDDVLGMGRAIAELRTILQ